MIKSHLELYLNGQWKSYDIYNQSIFDERCDGQIKSAMCYIITTEKTRFKPMRKAKLVVEDGTTSKTFYYFAYFKSQQRGPNYWWHEVTLIDVAKKVQGQLIDGMRVVQNENNSITLYDTFKRLCDTTPFRLTSESNLYTPTLSSTIIQIMQAIPSPEYSWSCRTLMWECLKEIGIDMGGYFPSVAFGDNGEYILSFFQTDNITNTITELKYISIAEGYDANQVCSEIDTDIANIIATNQGTASVVFPGQNGWISPRTDDVQLTDQNCEIQTPSIIEKIVKIYINQRVVSLGADNGMLYDITGEEMLDVTDFFPEYKKYQSLETLGTHDYQIFNTDLYKNNTCYWTEDSQALTLVPIEYASGWGVGFGRPAIFNLIASAIYKQYAPSGEDSEGKYITVNGNRVPFSYNLQSKDPRPLQFRVEYIPRDSSTKIRAVKQEKCDYEYVLPYNQRAEIVDAPSLGQELDKSVNQMGVNYIKTVQKYKTLDDILPIGTAYIDGADTYILTVNEHEQISNKNITVTHSFSKNWSMLSEYLKQNKQYRNTNIPTDILVRNLHYQDFIELSETKSANYSGFLSVSGRSYISKALSGGVTSVNTEINNMCIYRGEGTTDGVIVSCSSFAVKKSLVFSGKMQNNLTAGKKVDPDNDYYCQDVLYTDENGEIETGSILLGVGILGTSLNANSLPESNTYENRLNQTLASGVFNFEKSSAEHINFTYQIHFVSEMPDIVIGHMLAESCPLIQDRTESLTYQLWGLKKPLSKMATVVNSVVGSKVADINSNNMLNYWAVTDDSILLTLSGKLPSDSIGWAITDENGRLYLARNSKPNESQTIYFNYKHKYHEQD